MSDAGSTQHHTTRLAVTGAVGTGMHLQSVRSHLWRSWNTFVYSAPVMKCWNAAPLCSQLGAQRVIMHCEHAARTAL